MIYNVKKRTLHIGVHEKVKLSITEHKILICLSSGNAVTYKDISKYLYGFYSEYAKNAVIQFLYRIRIKTKKQLKIKTIQGVRVHIRK